MHTKPMRLLSFYKNTSLRFSWAKYSAALLLCGSLHAHAGEWGVIIHGFSYHPDRTFANGDKFNETNPGLGLTYIVSEDQKHIWFVEGGRYKDSGANKAVYFGPGYKYKLTESLSIGAGFFFANSDTYNSGKSFVAPIPLLSYRYKPVSVNLTYLPEISGVNDYATWGVYFAIWPKAF